MLDTCKECEHILHEEELKEIALLEARRQTQADGYRDALQPLYDGPLAALEALPELRKVQPGHDLRPKDVADIELGALHALARQLVEDDRLSWWEETILTQAGTVLGGLTTSGWAPPFSDLAITCAVGAANDGRLLSKPMPREVPGKEGEILHIQENAVRLDEVRVKELVLDQHALSFEFRDGVAYQRGRLTGTETETTRGIQETDRGQLLVTSQRIVFVGLQASEEIALSKLIGVQIYDDAVQFRISGRKRYPTFRLDRGSRDKVVAVVNAATQVANGTALEKGADIPTIPQASQECEALLERGARAGCTEQWVRGWRLLFHVGFVDMADLERNIEAMEAQSHRPADAAVVAEPRSSGQLEWLELDPKMGEPIGHASGDNYEIEITDIALLASDSVPPDVKPLGEFAFAQLRIRNKSKAPVQFYGTDVLLRDQDGTVYEAWSGGAEPMALGRHCRHLFLAERLQPKLWHEGVVVFDLPPDVALTSVQVPRSIPSAANGEVIGIDLPKETPGRIG